MFTRTQTLFSLRSLLAVAVIAVAAVASRTWDHLLDAGTAAVAHAKRFAVHVVNVLAPAPAEGRAPSVRLIQAKAFLARITRRERIQMTGGWRMCPSG